MQTKNFSVTSKFILQFKLILQNLFLIIMQKISTQNFKPLSNYSLKIKNIFRLLMIPVTVFGLSYGVH